MSKVTRALIVVIIAAIVITLVFSVTLYETINNYDNIVAGLNTQINGLNTEIDNLNLDIIALSSDPQNADTDNPAEEIVYITKTGKAYHTENCRYIQNGKNISYCTISAAESLGYYPCSKCH